MLLSRQGVCQDHAHMFLACCHAHGIPARYVSGYIDPETGHAASHAWVDAWVEDPDYTGWVSIDVTHNAADDGRLLPRSPSAAITNRRPRCAACARRRRRVDDGRGADRAQ
jgi:transglutaminase-like putative cysteine protease